MPCCCATLSGELHEIANRLALAKRAAQKRATRAMERLRDGLAARGIPVSVAALSGSVATQAVQVAPADWLPRSMGSRPEFPRRRRAVFFPGSPQSLDGGIGIVAAGLRVTVAWQAWSNSPFV